MKPRELIELGRILERANAATSRAVEHVIEARVRIRVAGLTTEIRERRS